MNLLLDQSAAQGYKSPSQRSRVITENWGLVNLYCPECDSNELIKAPNNTPVYDFECPRCHSHFQLKATSQRIGTRIPDAAYESMMSSILANETPHLYVLHYDAARFRVKNLLLVPRFSLSTSAIERRNPLGPAARRAGWVGCNIMLSKVPEGFLLWLIADSQVTVPSIIRQKYMSIQTVEQVGGSQRSWLLDVLASVRSLKVEHFSLAQVYQHEEALGLLHPSNRNVRAKIRQQLQLLRDLGLIEFHGEGYYSFKKDSNGRIS